jgi:hypothetical protein
MKSKIIMKRAFVKNNKINKQKLELTAKLYHLILNPLKFQKQYI